MNIQKKIDLNIYDIFNWEMIWTLDIMDILMNTWRVWFPDVVLSRNGSLVNVSLATEPNAGIESPAENTSSFSIPSILEGFLFTHTLALLPKGKKAGILLCGFGGEVRGDGQGGATITVMVDVPEATIRIQYRNK